MFHTTLSCYESPRNTVAWLYLRHFKTDFDCIKSKVGLFKTYNQSSYQAGHILPEMLWLARTFLPMCQPLQVGAASRDKL